MTEAKGPARGYPEVIRILETARGWIERGWAQGSASLRVGRSCAGIAIERESRDAQRCPVPERADAMRLFSSAIGEQDIIGWNDDPLRTQADVLAAFDRAIELASAASARNAPPEAPLAGSTEGKEKP